MLKDNHLKNLIRPIFVDERVSKIININIKPLSLDKNQLLEWSFDSDQILENL